MPHHCLLLPYSGSLRSSFPTFPISIFFIANYRYYDPLRLPIVLLGFIRFRSLCPIPLLGANPFVVFLSNSLRRLAQRSQSLVVGRPDHLPVISREDTIGYRQPVRPEFPSYPCKHMPCSKTPVVSQTLATNAFETDAFRNTQLRQLLHLSMFILLTTTIQYFGAP